MRTLRPSLWQETYGWLMVLNHLNPASHLFLSPFPVGALKRASAFNVSKAETNPGQVLSFPEPGPPVITEIEI